MTQKLFETVTTWQLKTFPTSTAISSAFHLQEEVKELITTLSAGEVDRAEIADCFLLLFDVCNRCGLKYADIADCIESKMLINYSRAWGRPNEKGYTKHINQ